MTINNVQFHNTLAKVIRICPNYKFNILKRYARRFSIKKNFERVIFFFKLSSTILSLVWLHTFLIVEIYTIKIYFIDDKNKWKITGNIKQ